MKKIILIDGNNLLFRSYYATAYSNGIMKNSKGFPTNALYGFNNMLNKIIKEENPDYFLVALDKGKTFRHDSFSEYKAKRQETPTELIEQIEYSKKLLDALGVSWKEAPGFEADDIIGTMAQNIDEDKEVLIISSDRDLLQLINDKVKVKLLKSQDYVLLDNNNFVKEYGIEPSKVIDLKGLQGDASDNIPGVKGIGEKTALKLLSDYKSIENIYANIENITGKTKEKLLEGKESAFMSKQLATIYKEIHLELGIEDIKYNGPNVEQLKNIYEELEFYSYLKSLKEVKKEETTDIKTIEDISELNFDKPVSIYIELDSTNYHTSKILGVGLYNETNSIFIPGDSLKGKLPNNIKYTYDLKKNLIALKRKGIELNEVSFDSMIAAYLLNYNVKDDISYLANQFGYDIPFFEVISKNKNIDQNLVKELCIKKAKFIYDTYNELNDKIIKENYTELFNDLEMPIIKVLADMECLGIKVDDKILKDMGEEIKIKLELLSNSIFNLAGKEFNINSYVQLGEVLFDKLGVPSNKKRSTDREHLIKYKDKYPIIEKILEYKLLNKIYTTYVVGLQNYIMEDSKIHTTYTQTLTRTGRLSSIEPNLQNIPIRYEYGRLIRKAFIPTNDLLLSVDYSQIELRVFAHFSKEKNLIDAFNHDMDIHTKTAMDLFGVLDFEVTGDMRRKAKAVNFGILYGISGFGLSENLDVDINEAKVFMDKYLETFPGIKTFMEETKAKAKALGYVETITGRKRIIEELNNANVMIRRSGERIALNTPIQGTSADIIKKAMLEIYKIFKQENIKSKMILQIHDELVFDVIEEEKEQIEKIVITTMENIIKLSVPLKVSYSYGKNWYETK